MSLSNGMITHFISDLDGTLLNSEKKIDAGNIEAIKHWQALGNTFMLASGRDKGMLKVLHDDYDVNVQDMICHSGASVYSNDRLLYQKKIDYDDIRRFIKVSSAYEDAIDYVIQPEGDRKYLLHKDGLFFKRIVQKESVVFESEPYTVMQYENDPVHQNVTKMFLLIEDAETEKRFMNHLRDEGINERMNVLKSGNLCYEICNKDANKGNALEFYIENAHIGVKNVAAIGDAENDLRMLQTASHSFVMNNAPYGIKQYGVVVNSVADAINQCIQFNENRKNEDVL